MIAWNSLTVADSDFDCRLFMMNSRITENENFKEITKQIPVSFQIPVIFNLSVYF